MAKKDNIDIEEYKDVILESASDKYWDYVYEYHVEADVVCDRLNEQNERLKELLEENKHLKRAFHLFSILAEDYHLTFEQLFEITREAIEKRR